MGRMTRQVVHLPSSRLLVRELEIAETPAARRKGLLGRDHLPKGEALLLPGAWSIHTFGMAFTIDVIYLTRDLVVRRVVPGLRPWRMSSCFLAAFCLEMPEDTLSDCPVAVGDQLQIQELE